MNPAAAADTTRNLTLYVTVVFSWGISWIALKLQVLAGVAPLASVAYRFAIAAAILLAFCAVRRFGLRFSPRQHARMAIQGVLLFGTNFVLMYEAAKYVASGLLSVAFSTVILFNIILGAIFLGNRLERRVLAGAVLGMPGIALVFWPEVSELHLGDDGLYGVLLALLGTVSASAGMTLSASNQRAGLKVMQTNAFGMAYGAIFAFLAALASGTPFDFAWTVPYVGSLVYLALVASIIAFGAYLTLVGSIGPERAAYASVLFPIVALAISTVYEGYVWTPEAFAGVILVLAGNVLVLTRPKALPKPIIPGVKEAA